MTEYAREFGKHVRSLRRARGLTQDVLAMKAGLSADTIRRVEHGSFSASIDTIRKLCTGLGVSQATLWESFELGRSDDRRELIDLIESMPKAEIALVMRVVRALVDELDQLREAG